MKQLRKRLSYANVMSSIAVFLVLGGATAIAADQLGKNSVGPKQLKKNAVTTAKIKNNAVTTSKIRNGAVTGAKINLGSLGTVPNAAHAGTADNAVHANNADTVAGNTIRRIFYRSTSTAAPTQLFTLNGLTLTAGCAGGEPTLEATTSVDNSLIHSVTVNNGDETFYEEFDEFDPGETFDVLSGENDSAQITFVYGTPSGATVTADLTVEEEDFANSACGILGNAIG